jgi:hypothetical protein
MVASPRRQDKGLGGGFQTKSGAAGMHCVD